jgi:hypothetical protein
VRLPAAFDALRDRDFRLLWLGAEASLLSAQMRQIANGVLAYELTGSAAVLAAVTLAQSLPSLFLSMFGGVIADRVRRRKLLLFSQSFLFFDSGRIWTPDTRFQLQAGELDQDKLYTALGAGVGYQTVVGAVEVAVGYKLNPSPLDIRSPSDVLAALDQGLPLSSVPTDNGRRWHLHFSIGSSF